MYHGAVFLAPFIVSGSCKSCLVIGQIFLVNGITAHQNSGNDKRQPNQVSTYWSGDPFAPFIHEYSRIMGKPQMFSFLTNVKQKFRTMEFLVGGYLKHEQTFILNISLAKLDVDIMDIIWTKVGHAILSLDPNNL